MVCPLIPLTWNGVLLRVMAWKASCRVPWSVLSSTSGMWGYTLTVPFPFGICSPGWRHSVQPFSPLNCMLFSIKHLATASVKHFKYVAQQRLSSPSLWYVNPRWCRILPSETSGYKIWFTSGFFLSTPYHKVASRMCCFPIFIGASLMVTRTGQSDEPDEEKTGTPSQLKLRDIRGPWLAVCLRYSLYMTPSRIPRIRWDDDSPALSGGSNPTEISS